MSSDLPIEKQLRAEAKAWLRKGCVGASHFVDLLTRAAGIIELQRLQIKELEQKASGK